MITRSTSGRPSPRCAAGSGGHHGVSALDHHKLLLIGLAAIVTLGVAAQWLAWRIRVPAILILLGVGIMAGPAAQMLLGYKLLDADQLLGPLVYPVVSLSVAVILFEGGLTLSLRELREVGRVVWTLVSLGAVVTWAVATVAAITLLGFSWQPALLLGAVLVVTGPTVIGPLLRHVRPTGHVNAILKWEGIVIDPIGATLALLVYEGIRYSNLGEAAVTVAQAIIYTIFSGVAVGAAAAALLVVAFRRFWVADYLQNPLALAVVIAAFALSNYLQDESGLLAVTVMGVVLANQRFVPFRHILDFKESLSVLLVSSLFVLLGCRLDGEQILSVINVQTLLFLVVLFLLARPLAVMVSTVGSPLTWRERVFLMGMAPRGIVAAAVSSIFALRLRESGYPEASALVPVTFAVIISTVIVYGLGSSALARRLSLSGGSKGGFLIAGANPVARLVGRILRDRGQQVMLLDTNAGNVALAKWDGLDADAISATSERALERTDGTGISRLLALTPSVDVNTLAALHFARLFGRSEVYQLTPDKRLKPADHVGESAASQREAQSERVSQELHGRVLFARGVTFETLGAMLAAGASVREIRISTTQSYDAMRKALGDALVPLFLISESGSWTVCTVDSAVRPNAGQTLIALVAADAPALPSDSRADSSSGAGRGSGGNRSAAGAQDAVSPEQASAMQ